MSEQKPAQLVASVNTGMTVGDGKQHRRYSPHIRMWGIAVFCLVILSSVGWLVYGHMHTNKPSLGHTVSSSNVQQGNKLPDGFTNFTPDQKAEYYLGIKNYTAAHNVYESELEAAMTPTDKANVYISLGGTAINAKDYKQAYQYGLQADAIAPSYPTAQFTAYAARMAGDEKDATKYYQLAIDRLPSMNLSPSNYSYTLGELQRSLKGENE